MRKYLIPAAALIAIAGGTVVVAQGAALPGTKDVAKVTGGRSCSPMTIWASPTIWA
jgi:hypothetical protein